MSNTQTFQVQGMTCGHCERAVTQALKSVDP
ncbi:MAG: Heavy-metal-associated domain, partial [Pseudomonadota bacterium]